MGFLPAEDLESWSLVAALFARSWFCRCWTFQEAALATNATIQVGAHLLDWADLCLASTFFLFKSYWWEIEVLRIGLGNISKLCETTTIGQTTTTGNQLQEWIPLPLMHLLTTTIQTQATLPQDRIFGLLALTEDSTQKYFWPSGSDNSPKYNMSVRELFTDASRFLLHESAGGSKFPLELLAYVKHYPLEEGEQEKRNKDDGGLMPSWVKRWHDPIPKPKADSEEDEVQPMYVISYLEHKRFFTGGLYHAPESNPQTPYEISLHGFVFATISNAVNFLRLRSLSCSRLWDLVLELRSVSEERHGPYPTAESIDEAFALMLTMADEPQSSHGAETYQATDFQDFCVWAFEHTLVSLIETGRIDDLERLRTEWEPEYERLQSLVGPHVRSPQFDMDMQLSCNGRKIFSTFSGYIGIGDVTLEPGDLVCVFLGGRTPFIIRPVGEKYKFVGECYLHGIMQGGALEEGLQRRELITLI